MTKVYLSTAIRHCQNSFSIAKELQIYNFNVLNPCEIIPDCPKENIPRTVASLCYSMIDCSSAIILYADYFGKDCAAELGYAIAKQKPIFPFFLVEKQSLEDDWMIYPFLEEVSFGLQDLANRLMTRLPK